MSDILSFISFDQILQLPWYVGIPGLTVIVLLMWSALLSILMLRPIKALVSLSFALLVAVLLSQGGQAIAQLVGGAPA